MIKMTPLPASFMLIGMLGLIITTVYTIYGKLDLSWGIAFDIVFACMFVASIISITPSEQKTEEAEINLTARAKKTRKAGKRAGKKKKR